MTNRDKYFKGQHDEENFVCFFRHHGIVLVKEFTYFAIFLFLLSLCLAEVSVIKDVIREDRAMKLLFVTCFLILTALTASNDTVSYTYGQPQTIEGAIGIPNESPQVNRDAN